MKKTIALIAALLLVLLCTLPALAEDAATSDSHILVAYFSRVGNTDFPADVDASSSASLVLTDDGLQGNIGFMADHIAKSVGGDLFLIQTTVTYPISYDETLDVAAEELADNVRPQLVATVENLEQYDTVFLGYPNWWGDMPMAVYQFIAQNDLTGKTVIPFASSGSSGFSGTQRTLAELLPGATLLEGLHIAGSRVTGAQADIDAWLEGLGIE